MTAVSLLSCCGNDALTVISSWLTCSLMRCASQADDDWLLPSALVTVLLRLTDADSSVRDERDSRMPAWVVSSVPVFSAAVTARLVSRAEDDSDCCVLS